MQRSNFQFLYDKWPILSDLGMLSEKNLYDDPNTSIIKLGMFAERLIELIFIAENMAFPIDDNQYNRILKLKEEDLIQGEVYYNINELRKMRNLAVHARNSNLETAKRCLLLAFNIGVWFMLSYGDWNFNPHKFVMPKKEDNNFAENKNEYEKILKDYNDKVNDMEVEVNKLKEFYERSEIAKRKEKSLEMNKNNGLNENDVKKIIDEYISSNSKKAPISNIENKKTNEIIIPKTNKINFNSDSILLPDNLMGRSIDTKIIPTVCNLKNMLEKLISLNWDYMQLKQWERRSYKAYLLDDIKFKIQTLPQSDWPELLKDHILSKRPTELGASCIDIYVVAFVATNLGVGLENFQKYILNKNITTKKHSIQAIWQVGKGDGIYLDVLNNDGSVKDWGFFKSWVDGSSNKSLVKT